MRVDVDHACRMPSGCSMLPVHQGTNGQVSTWGPPLAGSPPSV
ncbi:MAG: hypothetical protein ACTHXO_08435 [Actinomycetaceae bacterium]